MVEATGVILAGGKSSRMKYNKAFAQIKGQANIEIIISKFRKFFAESIIISNQPELYLEYGLEIYTDIFPRKGPISGIHSGLSYSTFDSVFILGCDMPFINMNLVEFMLQQLGDYDSVVPEIGGFLQPTSAVYSKKCLPVLTDCLENDKLKLTLIFKELDAVILNEWELRRFGNIRDIFLNVNDLQALEFARKISGRLL